MTGAGIRQSLMSSVAFVRARLISFVAVVSLAVFVSPVLLQAQVKKPTTLSDLVAYTGADREKILIAGAKAEGKVVWYTSLAGSSYKELAQGFEKKYPGIKVDVYRAASNELMARITAEAKARQYLVDTIETTLPLLKSLREDGLLAVYASFYQVSNPCKGERRKRALLLGRQSRKFYRSRLQSQLDSAERGAKEFQRSFASPAKGQDGAYDQ